MKRTPGTLAALPRDRLGVLWVGRDWDAGLAALKRITALHQRGRILLWGDDPPDDLTGRVWAAGGLAWAPVPFPAWLTAPAIAATRRWDEVPSQSMLQGLPLHAQQPPASLARRLARALSKALRCSRWDAAVRGDAGELESLVMLPGGVKPLADRRPLLPVALEASLEQGAVTVYTALEHIGPAGASDRFKALAVIPLRAPPAPDGVIALYWSEPFLPNPREAQLLQIAALAGAVAWGRLAEEQRRSRAHLASLDVLSTLPWQAEARTPDTRPMLQRLLSASADLPGLLELWACAAVSSRAPPQWVGLSGSGVLQLGGAERDIARAAPGAPVHRLGDRCWLTSTAIDGAGVLVATFESSGAAEAAQTALSRLTADLSLGLRLLRRSSDNNALIELSRVLAEVTEPRPALVKVSEIIREQLSADGVSVYLMVTQGTTRHLEQLLRSSERRPAEARVAVSERKGLVDWVVHADDWLLMPRAPAPRDRAIVQTGDNGTQALVPRTRSDNWGQRPAPAARTRLLVPLRRQGQVVGVLGAWRETDDPFDPDLDVETMQHLAPHITNACVRLRGTERIKTELESTQRLAAALRPGLSPAAIRHRILAEVCALTGWPRAVMFLHDTRQTGRLYFAAGWATERADKPPATALRALYVDAGPHTEGWPAMLSARLHRHFPPSVPMRGALIQGRHEQPRGVVVLVGKEDGPAELPLTPQLDGLILGSFLRYAGALLDNHAQAFSDAVGDTIERASNAPRTLGDTLAATARFLSAALEADAVIVDELRGRQVVSRTAAPPAPPALQVTGDGPAARLHSPPHSETARILDTSDPADPGQRAADLDQLQAVQDAYGWASLRSWIAAPIKTDGRILGLVQAFSADSGAQFGPDEQALVEAAAAWAGTAVGAALRRQTLEELNTITHTLAGMTGASLGRGAIEAIGGWLERHLGRRCGIALIAWTPPRSALLEASNRRIDSSFLEQLRALSLEWNTRAVRWGPRSRLGSRNLSVSRAGIAAPLRLPGEPLLRGHLIALHRAAFSDSDKMLLGEAARELANLLHGELIQQEWRFQNGLFRHALLGPVQGLHSAALEMARQARAEAPDAAAIKELEDQVHKEAEIIRLWRETQRAFASMRDGAPMEIRARVQPLRPLLERCLRRYARAFKTRGITARLDWSASGSIRFMFDKVALDLAVSNMLDNARKYAFFNRIVTLGAAVAGPDIVIWIEDIGAEVPSDEAIYELRKRTDRQDPLRAIHGEGIGLYIARAVARAHGGHLSHTSQREGAPGDNAPHRVRFTLRLPHHWRRG